MNGKHASQHSLEGVERDHVGPITRARIGFGMGFKEDSIDAHGRGCPGQRLDEASITASRFAQAGGLLHGVRRIENDGHPEGSHHWKPREVIDQAAVAEERASLAEKNVLAIAGKEFGNDMAHVARSNELTFLDVHRPAGRRCSQQDVGLPTEKGGDLKQVTHLASRRRLFGQVDICRDRQTGGPTNALKYREPLINARAAIGLPARSIGLVERCLENGLNGEPRGKRGKTLGDEKAEILPFNHAGPGNHDETFTGSTSMRADHGREARIQRRGSKTEGGHVHETPASYRWPREARTLDEYRRRAASCSGALQNAATMRLSVHPVSP